MQGKIYKHQFLFDCSDKNVALAETRPHSVAHRVVVFLHFPERPAHSVPLAGRDSALKKL